MHNVSSVQHCDAVLYSDKSRFKIQSVGEVGALCDTLHGLSVCLLMHVVTLQMRYIGHAALQLPTEHKAHWRLPPAPAHSARLSDPGTTFLRLESNPGRSASSKAC